MLNRRDFLRTAAAIGAGFSVKPVNALSIFGKNAAGRFDVHPFVEEHPEAVFVMKTNVGNQRDSRAKRGAGELFAHSVMVPVEKGGTPLTHMIPIKPNLTSSMWDNQHFPLEFGHGIVTDPFFVEGVIEGMKGLGLSGSQFYLREVNGPECYGPRGYTAMAERSGADIRDLSTDVRKMPSENIQWTRVPDPAFHKKLPYLWPINAKDTFFLNIAKFKSHFIGLTLTCKNLQGSVGNNYQQFCHGEMGFKYNYEHLVRNAQEKLLKLYEKHVEMGYHMWEQGHTIGEFENRTEIWANRTLDNVSATKMGLCIVEGIFGREGAFHRGPNPAEHNDQGISEARDFMTNIIIFGKDPILVDNVGHWIGGHETGNYGFFHLAMERGLTSVLDPRKIPVYTWSNSEAVRTPLEKFTRTPLRTDYFAKKQAGNTAEEYILLDDPFDYSKVDEDVPSGNYQPGVRILDNMRPSPSNTYLSFEYTIAKPGYTRLDIVSESGDILGIIVNGYQQKGPGCASWNISGRQSGTYYYNFASGDFRETGKIDLRYV
ncbi:DUF362 domain-containing protein [Candidatus Latescibacterota bacterium]